MIDCENEVYSRIINKVRSEYPDIDASSEYVHKPSSFPHVTVEMHSNTTYRKNSTSNPTEEMSMVMFEVQIHSNKKSGKKSECKKILQIIDEEFFRMNFARISYSPVPNMEDSSIYRIAARYRAMTDGKYFYRR